jgi:RNA polymerase sigma-70 factor (ECF subfamily)
MMTKQPMATTDVDRLLGQARWVEGFARALVREDSDDVAQDAWLAAIQHPPAPAASPRPWFATVMRNLKRMRFRSASRRRAREEASAPDEKVPTPAELTHRMELQRRLASAVLALEEPQRSTVVLVFYEGRSPADVARRQGVPATTVRSRMRAALVTLRQRLDAEEGGDRGRWHLALAPIVAPKLVPATAPVWPLAFAAIAVLATTGVVIAIQHHAAPAEIQRDDASTSTRPIDTRAPTTAMSFTRTPDPPSLRSAPTPTLAIAGDDEALHQPSIPPAFRSAENTLMKHVDECYEISHRVGHDLKGLVHLTISLETTELGVDANVEIDKNHTTIVDPDFLECIRENARAIEDSLERLRAQGEHIEGPLKVHVVREMPPTPEGTELVQVSPPDDEPLQCPEGTTVAGTQGTHQWCVLPDGTKHGPEWFWDKQGHVTARTSYDHGTSRMETRSPDSD